MAERIKKAADTFPIAEYASALQIDKHDLDEELIRQPDLFYKVSEQLVLAISQRDAAKKDLEKELAEADEEIRRKARDKGEKITESAITARKQLDDGVIKMENRLSALNLQVGKLSALKESFAQRSHVLRDLRELYIANYYGSGEAQQDREQRYNRARKAMDEERKRIRNRDKGNDD